MVCLKSQGEQGHELVKDKVLLMGIVNVTPDSFSDGGQFDKAQAAVHHAVRLAKEGADIVDIGGESTRPGATTISVDEELARVMPVIEGLRTRGTDFAARISIDTRKARVMQEALAAGADIINDVTALEYDRQSLQVAAGSNCPVILMHGLMRDGRGDPKTMQAAAVYEDVVAEVFDYLQGRIRVCQEAGIERSRLVIDPGIGFAKTLEHNLTLLARLDHFAELGVPLLLGASRKRFIGAVSGEEDPQKRFPGSMAAALAGVAQGAKILRVHDVAKTRQALSVWQDIAGEEA